jgi:hypothetical protein
VLLNLITVGTGEAPVPEAGPWPNMIRVLQSNNARHNELRNMIVFLGYLYTTNS